MRPLTLLLGLLTASHFAHATPLDNGDLLNIIASNLRTSEEDMVPRIVNPDVLKLVAFKLELAGEYDRAIRINEELLARYQAKRALPDAPPIVRVLDPRAKGAPAGKYEYYGITPDLGIKGDLARAYVQVGRFNEAVRYAEEVAQVRRDMYPDDDNHVLLNQAIDALVEVYFGAGQLEKARVLQEQVIQKWRQPKYGSKPLIGSVEGGKMVLADIFMAQGQFEKARALHEKAIRDWSERSEKEKAGLVALTPVHGLANTQRALGKPKDALPLYEQYLDARRSAGIGKSDVDIVDPLIATIALARTYQDLNQPGKARAMIPTIIKETERLRAARPRTADDRQRTFAMFSDIYQQMAVWSAGAGEIEEAFNIGDLSKARTLAEGIRTQTALRALPPGEQQALRDLARQSQELRNRTSAELHRQDKGEVEHDRRLLDELKGRFERMSVQLPMTVEVSKIDTPSAQHARDLLGKDEVFINYLVTSDGVRPHIKLKNGMYAPVEAAQKNKAQVFIVDGTGAIRWVDLGRLPNLAQTVAAYRELVTSHDAGQLAGQLAVLKDGGYRWVEKGQAAPAGSRPEPVPAGSTPATHALRLLQRYWHDTLIKPVLPLAGAHSRWIISPDKDLALLPFDTLPETFTAKGEPGKLLAETRNITLAQSFSVYALLKKREVEYAALPRSRTLLAMGNPIYDNSGWAENRGLRRGTGKRGFTASGEAASPGVAAAALVENAEQRAMAGLKWENLPGTAEEIRRITDVFGGTTGGVDGLTGADASEGKLRELNNSGKLKDYRYLLFSAHGYLAKNPTLSSLVLSQHGNPAGLDGYVTAGEWPLYDVRSDLTVLSACDTGVGKVQAGESVLGLPYALFVAGNRNTLLSLWPVADEATAEFMALFFGKLKQGKSQPVALSETKQEFMRHRDWKDPVFWAAFVLYGV